MIKAIAGWALVVALYIGLGFMIGAEIALAM